MKKLILPVLLICFVLCTPAAAQTQGNHAVGDMYTKVLNIIEARGQLDTLEPKKHVRITNIHIDHGQVFITLAQESGEETFVYDMMGNRVVSPGEKTTTN